MREPLLKTGRIVIQGVELSRLRGIEYDIISDRIVAGTYLFAALAAGGEVALENVPIRQLDSICDTMKGDGGCTHRRCRQE